MILPRQALRALNGLAILAALLLAFAPGISQVRQNSVARWAELCTTEGLRRIQISADANGGVLPAERQGTHSDCGYCPLQAGTPPALPLLAMSAPSPAATASVPRAYATPYLINTNSPQLGSRGPPQTL